MISRGAVGGHAFAWPSWTNQRFKVPLFRRFSKHETAASRPSIRCSREDLRGLAPPNYASGGIARQVPKSVNVNVRSYGAVGDGQAVADCSTTSGSAVVTCTSSHFLRADVGKVIVIWQAGPSSGNYQTPLSTTIRSYQSGTQVTLGLAASQTQNPAPHTAWGTNNQTAVANAIANSACAKTSASDLSGCVLYFPRGHYMLQTVEFPCGAIGTFGSFTCTTMASSVTIAGDSTTASTIEEWDGNITGTACSPIPTIVA